MSTCSGPLPCCSTPQALRKDPDWLLRCSASAAVLSQEYLLCQSRPYTNDLGWPTLLNWPRLNFEFAGTGFSSSLPHSTRCNLSRVLFTEVPCKAGASKQAAEQVNCKRPFWRGSTAEQKLTASWLKVTCCRPGTRWCYTQVFKF